MAASLFRNTGTQNETKAMTLIQGMSFFSRHKLNYRHGAPQRLQLSVTAKLSTFS